MSLEGNTFKFLDYRFLQILLNNGTNVAVAAGNSNKNLNEKCNVFPACLNLNSNNFRVVGSNTANVYVVNNTVTYSKYSNYGTVVTALEDGTDKGTPQMSGTSQATAIYTSKWINQ